MPGSSPYEAVEAFMRPLRESFACIGGRGQLSLSPKARSSVGEPHVWALNGGEFAAPLPGSKGLEAAMHFEVLDQGSSRRDERFRVSTRAYKYALLDGEGRELVAAHWHPDGASPIEWPHWHFGSVALSPEGVFLERAHVPSPRVSFERFVELVVDSLKMEPERSDWRSVLTANRGKFEEHRSWGV